MRVEYLYRFPVKGLTAEALEATDVTEGDAIPWDRAFALAQGDAPFDPAKPAWLMKDNFMCLKKNASIALLRSHFEPRAGILTIRAPNGDAIEESPLTERGRARLAAFLAGYLGAEARGTPRFHYVPGHVFGDQRAPVLSLINLASLRDFEARVGTRRHRRRFRANVWFSGSQPWSELDWVGREIQLGGATLRVTKRIARCPATEVNPETGYRDANPVDELRRFYNHVDLGVHAQVIAGGHFSVGDALEVLPE